MNRTHLIRLRETLSAHFTEGELRTLCFDLNVDYDGLLGQCKADKTRELVAFLERHGYISELVVRGKQIRPNLTWDSFDDDKPSTSLSPSFERLQRMDKRSNSSPITLFVAYNCRFIRAGIRTELAPFSKNIKIVGEAEYLDDTIKKVQELIPDVLLMNLEMSRNPEKPVNCVYGVLSIHRINSLSPKTRILVIIDKIENDQTLFDAVGAGARGCVSKNILYDNQELADRISHLYNGEISFSPEFSQLIWERIQYSLNYHHYNDSNQEYLFEKLTAREKEVAVLIAEKSNPTNSDIAETLRISESTVKTHVSKILEKLRISSRDEIKYILPRNHRDK